MKLEWFSIDCSKTEAKEITLANHMKHKQRNQSELEAKNMLPVQSTGKRLGAYRDWLKFCFSVIEEVARISLTNHKAFWSEFR